MKLVTHYAASVFTVLLALTTTVYGAERPSWEFNVASGVLAPTGSQQEFIKRGEMTSAQLAYLVRPGFALTGSFGWARSRDLTAVLPPKLDIFSYDLGGEFRGQMLNLGSGINLRPLVGVGIGARTYSYRDLDLEATSNPAAYISAGGEFGLRRLRVKVEVRDYVSGFKSLDGRGASRVANDIAVIVGLRLVQR